MDGAIPPFVRVLSVADVYDILASDRPYRAAMPHDAFIDPATGEPYPFTPERVTSGVSVGTPGTLATW